MPDPAPLVSFLLVATVGSAVLHLRADAAGIRWQVYVFKPLTTAFLLLLAIVIAPAHGAGYQAAVAIGVAFSLGGDIFLMLPKDRFVPGLASFLAAHVAYTAAFAAGVPFGSVPLLLLLFVAAAIPVLRLLWPGLGTLRIPVLAYVAAILLMVWMATARSWVLPTPGAALAAAGALLFVISDALLAVNRFHRPLQNAQILVMTTYVAAQILIVLSVGTI